jgi:hypothetical protein
MFLLSYADIKSFCILRETNFDIRRLVIFDMKNNFKIIFV